MNASFAGSLKKNAIQATPAPTVAPLTAPTTKLKRYSRKEQSSIDSRFSMRKPLVIPLPMRAPDAVSTPNTAGAAIPAVRNVKPKPPVVRRSDVIVNLTLFISHLLLYGST